MDSQDTGADDHGRRPLPAGRAVGSLYNAKGIAVVALPADMADEHSVTEHIAIDDMYEVARAAHDRAACRRQLDTREPPA